MSFRYIGYTQYTVFNIKKKSFPKSAARGFFSNGLKIEFEIAVVNEPSVFEPLKFYSILTDCESFPHIEYCVLTIE